jgi:hypothetical protein
MKWEWSFGELILIAFALYELWSLRKYDRPKSKSDQTPPPPKDPAS